MSLTIDEPIIIPEHLRTKSRIFDQLSSNNEESDGVSIGTMTDGASESNSVGAELTIHEVILKYQLLFTRYFGPKHAYGVIEVSYHPNGNNNSAHLVIKARVKPAHQPSSGRIAEFTVPMKKFNVWRDNIQLYNFIKVGVDF